MKRRDNIEDTLYRGLVVFNKKQPVSKENCIYGSRWNTLHDGYFSDLDIAFPLIEAIKRAIKTYRSTIVADS